MRTLILLVYLCCSMLRSQSQPPPKTSQLTKEKGTVTGQAENGPQQHQQPSKSETPPIQSKVESQTKQNPANTEPDQELEINHKLATFTGWLVAVGVVQFFAMVAQSIIFWRTLRENRRQISAAVIAANAAKDSNELTRQSLILTHRPKIVIRYVSVLSRDSTDITNPLDSIFQNLRTNGGQLFLVNIGNSSASVKRSYSAVISGEQPPRTPFHEVKPGTAHDVELPPGASISVPFPTEPCTSKPGIQRFSGGWEHVWAIGWVEYADGGATIRRTGFCRRLSNETYSFVSASTPYEYAD